MQLTPILPGKGEFAPDGPGDLAFQKRLQESQWWPAERLREHQDQLLRRLLAHAQRVPLYRQKIGAAGLDLTSPLQPADWRRMPALSRRDLQLQANALATDPPSEHGALLTNKSSGSTGAPVAVQGSVFDAWVFKSLNLRHYLWHPHDFAGRFVSIRHVDDGEATYPTGASYSRWGDTATFPFATGPSAALSIGASISEQAEWLARQDPDYVLSYPSNLLGLARHCRREGIMLPHLEFVETMGEVVNAGVREAVRDAWDAPLIDIYSAQEVGVIAEQCPDNDHYHVPAETILVEVIDEAGEPCGPGQVGRVLVTPLFNYAMPLLRYELGDYAEVGPPCPCGRGLPVLTRILGRERNALLVAPSGERYWPAFGSRKFSEIAPIVQHQFVQKDAERIEARLVTERPLTLAEETALRQHVLAKLPWPFQLSFVYTDRIARNAGGKFENFISEFNG